MFSYDYFASPQGRMLLVAEDKALTAVCFVGQKYAPRVEADWKRDGAHALLRQAKRELAEYFAGKRTRFSVKLAPHGTPFQRSVWKAIAGVGFGKTIPYAELARRAGRPGSARAAGAAPLAALLKDPAKKGKRFAVILSGGNIDRELYLSALNEG